MSQTKRKVNELEKEFRDIATTVSSSIKEELDKALEHIKKAEEISEQYGIPFNSPVAMKSDYYVPTTFDSKFCKTDASLDEDELEELQESMHDAVYDVCKVDSSYESGWGSDGWSMSSLNC